MKSFWKGVFVGITISILLVLLVLGFRFFYDRDRKIFERMEREREIELLREEYGNRPSDEFLDDPGVRGAADNAAGEFERKRDEAVQRIRNERAD